MISEKNLFLLLTFLLLILLFSKKLKKNISLKNKIFQKNIENFVSQNSNDKQQKKNIKVGIVSMVTKQPDFEFWLKYHLEHLKLDLIILRVEDSPEYKPLLDKYGDRVIATYHNKNDIDLKHNYLTIMDRQKEHVNNGLHKAKELGIDYMFHSDADELIYVEKDNFNTHPSILLRFYLESVPEVYSCIHLKNFEAVFPNNKDKCFNTNKFIDCKKGNCLSYANGKSVGRIKHNIKFKGPHYFTGKVYNISDYNIAILHFDSCTYKQWENKFELLKDTNEEKMKKIPFNFYKNSIKKLQKCGGNKKNIKCKNELNKFYQEQKILPYTTKNTREMNFY